MNIKDRIVECPIRKFRCIEYEFNYKSDTNDKKLLNELIEKGEKLAEVVNPTLARDASRTRGFEVKKWDCIGGVIAEYCWIDWLNSQAKIKNLKVSVSSSKFLSANKQIDIIATYPDNSETKVEVRSSFPYTGLENAVCRVFDIIGWYTNPVKTEEKKKDYYVRILHPFRKEKLLTKLTTGSYSAFLTGGASCKLLEESPYSKDKEFIPYDNIDSESSSKKGVYRVIEPIVNANDTYDVTNHILNKTM